MLAVIRGISPFFLLLLGATTVGAVLAAVGTGPVLVAGIVLVVLGGWAVSLCLHEFAHALVAHRSGDLSVRARGYLTLDIRRYTNVALTLVLPVLFLLLGGIPLPGGAVLIDHGAIRSRAARSLVSFAGPAVNLVLGLVLVLVVAAVPMAIGLAAALSCLALIQVLAFVLNILPVPGLDGFGVLEPYLSPGARLLAAKVAPWAPLVLLVVLLGLPGASAVLFGIGDALFGLIGGDGRLANAGYAELLFWR
ncbi:site-2 protease family protein [Pseudonocardia charpentierae]|uniref:Site-2 protease family protein n=1 Tax=Pseudonocardia charpentierae TaxID=3075545 RepID=A0ABU2N519_9PSEU|nr:site-2 protease family protein [Pseudonocardia sp. DSM 45834]MDT0348811.1 site-2 protease family protein [Pseudonocardia sp. DSM 45834]